MYTQYFGLRAPLFRLSDNPAGQYLTAQNKVAYKQLYTGLAEGKKVLVLTGVAGSGKKTLVRRAVSELRESCALIELQTGDLQMGEFIDSICSKLGVEIDTTGTKSQRITGLKKTLQSQRIKHTVVLIEQMREIHSDLVKSMLLLSGHESDCSLSLQFVVVGVPDPNKRIEQLVLRSFDRNELSFCCIESLDSVEVASYVEYYLDQVGCKNKMLFTLQALERIAKYSGGVPRLINLLCNGGLLAAYLEEKKNVDAAMIDEASIHCLYIGPGGIQPLMNEKEIELPAKADSPTEKITIVQGWPFENQQEGFEMEASSTTDLMLPESKDKQSSSAAIVEVEDANSPVESVWDRLSSNGSWNQALPTNTDTLVRSNAQIQQSDGLQCDQDLNSDNADEFTPPKKNSGAGQGLPEMIKKASKFDIPDQNNLRGPYDWAEWIHSAVDLEKNATVESVNTENAEKSQGFTANSDTLSSSHTSDNEYEWGKQLNPIEQSSDLKDQGCTVDSVYGTCVSLSEIIGKAADHSATLRSKLGLSANYSESIDGFDFDREVGSWMGLEVSKSDQVAKLDELIGRFTLNNKSGAESNIKSELPGKSYPGFSGDQEGAEPLGEGSPTNSTQPPRTDSGLLSSLHPQRPHETQSGEKLDTESMSSPSKSFSSILVVLGIIALGMFVTFDLEQRPAVSNLNTGAEVDSRLSDISLAPVDKTSIEPEHSIHDKATSLHSGLISVETDNPTDRREADKLSEPVNRQADLIKIKTYRLKTELDAWVRLAEQQLSKKQLTTPKNDNALASYRAILKADPAHEKALSGIQKIKETYMLWARNEIRRSNVQHARMLYQKALDVAPNNAEVLTALEDLKSSQRNTAKRLAEKSDTAIFEFVPGVEQIDELLDRANRQMYLNQLVVPAGNNALSTYRRVLRLAPRNSEALDGIAGIKSIYVNWAKLAMDNHDWDRAEVFYERALLADLTDRTVISMLQGLKMRRVSNR